MSADMQGRTPLPIRAYVYLVITTLLWGGNTIAGKLALGHVSPMALSFGRWAVATIVIASISVPQIRKDWDLLKANWKLLIFYGAVGYAAFNGFLYTALKYTSAVNGAIEQGAIPVLIFVINFLLFRIPVSAVQILGFVISFAGAAITASHGDLQTLVTLTLNYGDLLMLCAGIAYAIYTISLRWKPAVHWKSLMAMPALAATLTSLPLLWWEASEGQMIAPDTRGWLIILYCGFFPSLISQILYIKGVEGIGANRAGLFINLVPVFGTLLSITLLGETLEVFHIIALALVLGGIAIAEWGKPREQDQQVA
jgi:drug/metabolite transporter (DMT)-like permease